VAAGRQCRRRVAAAAALLSRAPRQRPGVVEVAPETDKWAPVIFLFNKIFRHPHFDIRKGDLPVAPETDKWDPEIFLFNKIFRHPHFDI
jgi:hypothetical protein